MQGHREMCVGRIGDYACMRLADNAGMAAHFGAIAVSSSLK